MEISGKNVVITGGASGIGKALAKAFKSAGANYVLIADQNEENGKAVSKELDVKFIKTNVAKESEIIELIKTSN